MSDLPQRKCPLTGKAVTCRPFGSGSFPGTEYCVSDRVWVGIADVLEARWDVERGVVSVADATFGPNLVGPAIALLRSRLWRAVFDGGRSLLVTTVDHARQLEANPPDWIGHWSVFAIEDVIEEAAQLSFTEKALNTLENLHDLWRRDGKLPSIPYASINAEGRYRFTEHSEAMEDGTTYGCDARTAPLVYQWLQAQGLLSDPDHHKNKEDLAITPSGIVEVERIRSGKEASLKRGFFIRKWDEELDAFFKPIMAEVAAATGCEIAAVWEKEKNAKIDELILRRIREASVIVLDVTGERFNVGLEAGYALALRKQIVLIADKDQVTQLPFDIRTLNCFFYDRNEPEKLTEKLKERVLDALEEARLGTH